MKKQVLLTLFSSLTFLSFAQAPAFQWANQMGGSSYDSGNAIAVDASGNVFTAGYFSATSDFDPGPGTATLVCNGSYDAFLTKFDAAGNFVWVKHVVAGNSTSYALAVKADAAGNVYVGGVFNGTADFDPAAVTNTVTSNGNDDMFISKFDPSGNLSWTHAIGGTDNDALNSISLDASGNVYATGAFSSTVDFDPGAPTYTLSAATADVFVLKLNNSGAFVWAKQLVGGGMDNGSYITTDASGKVYVTGSFEGTLDFDPGAATYSLTALGATDSYILQLDASGVFGWAKQFGGVGEYSYSYSLATDAMGNVYNAGTFSGTVDLDPGVATQNVTSAGLTDFYFAKLNSSGTFLWAKTIGGSGEDYVYGIATDAANNTYITGSFQNAADFDPSIGTYMLSASGNNDMFITKFNASGNMLWATAYGGVSSDVYGYGIYVDAASSVYTTGSFNLVEDFNPTFATYTLSSVGFTDVFTLKLGQCTAPAAPVITSTTTAALSICSGNSVTLSATGTGTLSWYTSATSTTAIATGASYTTPLLSAGTYTYYASATTCTSSATRASVTVTVNTCTSIESLNTAKAEVRMYPNPTNGLLTLKLSAYQHDTVRIYDVLGSQVLEQILSDEVTTINLEGQATGVYMVVVTDGQQVISTKRIIKE